MSCSLRARITGVLLVAALGPVLVLLRTRSNGLNISPDSAAYLAAADGIASGRGVVGVDDRAMSLYAPGLPSLLALPARWGAAEDAARWLNLLLLAVLVGGCAARRATCSARGSADPLRHASRAIHAGRSVNF